MVPDSRRAIQTFIVRRSLQGGRRRAQAFGKTGGSSTPGLSAHTAYDFCGKARNRAGGETAPGPNGSDTAVPVSLSAVSAE